MLDFDCILTKRIETPEPVATVRRAEASGVPALWGELFGPKAGWLRQGRQDVVRATFAPVGPFGVDPGVLAETLFTNLRGSAEAVCERLGLRRIEIDGLEPDRWASAGAVRFIPARCGDRRRPGWLSGWELRRLADAVVDGVLYEGRVVTVFVDPGRVASVRAANGSTLREAIGADRAVAGWAAENPEARPRHPITGRAFDVDRDVVGPETELLYFAEGGYVPRPRRGMLRAFPYVRRRVGMRRGRLRTRPVRPCNNCLACARVCPAGLYPSVLYHNLLRDNLDEAVGRNLAACIQCGRCGFVCPARIPLPDGLARGLTALRQEQAQPREGA